MGSTIYLPRYGTAFVQAHISHRSNTTNPVPARYVPLCWRYVGNGLYICNRRCLCWGRYSTARYRTEDLPAAARQDHTTGRLRTASYRTYLFLTPTSFPGPFRPITHPCHLLPRLSPFFFYSLFLSLPSRNTPAMFFLSFLDAPGGEGEKPGA